MGDARDISSTDGNFPTAGEHRERAAGIVATNRCDQIVSHDLRAMDAHELRGIEAFGEIAEARAHQAHALADVQPHVIAVGFEPLDHLHRHAHARVAFADPQLGFVFLLRAAVAALGAQAVDDLAQLLYADLCVAQLATSAGALQRFEQPARARPA